MFKLFSLFASRAPDDPRERALRAFERGEFEVARLELTDLLESGRHAADDRAFLLNKRGASLARLGDCERARDDFHAALLARPGYPPALVNLGNLALEGGCVDAAIAQYETAIASDAEYAAAYFNLSVAFKRQRRFAESVRALRTAQKLERKPRRSAWRTP